MLTGFSETYAIKKASGTFRAANNNGEIGLITGGEIIKPVVSVDTEDHHKFNTSLILDMLLVGGFSRKTKD